MTARRLILLLAMLSPLALSAPAHAFRSAPYNDDLDDAGNLGSASTISAPFDLQFATDQPGEPSHGLYAAGHTVWFKWQAPATAGTHISICNVVGSRLKVYTGSGYPLSAVSSGYGTTLPSCQSDVHFKAVAGTTYRIAVDHSEPYGPPSGMVKVQQRTTLPKPTFPGWPATSGKNLQSPLRTQLWQVGWDEWATSFQCFLDVKTPVYCDEDGPNLKGLAHGQHVLSVEATDGYGNKTGEYVQKTWNVDAKPPTTTITSWQGQRFVDAPPTVTWTASESGVAFRCKLDLGEWFDCQSGWKAPELGAGNHYLQVWGKDAYGNFSPSSTTAHWYVETPATTTTTKPPVQQPEPPKQPQSPWTTTSGGDTRPCAPVVRPGRATKRSLTRGGLKVRIKGDAGEACTVTLKLMLRTKRVARVRVAVPAGRDAVVRLKPRRKVGRGKLRLAVLATDTAGNARTQQVGVKR